MGNPSLRRRRMHALIGGTFTALWTAILFRTVQQHGNWVPWAAGLATWLAAFVIATLRYNRVKTIHADPEETDERLRAVEGRAGQTAFQAQSFLLLITIILLSYWGRGDRAFPIGPTEILTVIVLFGSAVYIFTYYWYRYRVPLVPPEKSLLAGLASSGAVVSPDRPAYPAPSLAELLRLAVFP